VHWAVGLSLKANSTCKIDLESQFKGWSGKKKDALIQRNCDKLKGSA